MSNKYNENSIREAAYYCWKNAGCPNGQDEYFWNMAINQLYGSKCSKTSCNKTSSCSSSKKTSTTAKKATTATKKTLTAKTTTTTNNTKK